MPRGIEGLYDTKSTKVSRKNSPDRPEKSQGRHQAGGRVAAGARGDPINKMHERSVKRSGSRGKIERHAEREEYG